MPVLLEAISVVIRIDVIQSKIAGGWPAFLALVRNQTLCNDAHVARVGFMVPSDAEACVSRLERAGLLFQANHTAQDLTIVYEQTGPIVATPWIESGLYVCGTSGPQVKGCRLLGDTSEKLVVPSSWPIGNMTFMTAADALSSLKFLRQQADGVDAYLNTLTGQEVYIGRTEVIEGRSFEAWLHEGRTLAQSDNHADAVRAFTHATE